MNLLKRIEFSGKVDDISTVVCAEFELGNFVSTKIITMGYEDFNFILTTSKGKFFVKVFAKFRTMKDCERYSGMIEEALKKGVNTPKLLKSKQGHVNILKIKEKRLRLVVMEFIEGETLFEKNSKLSDKEINFLAKQAAKINKMRIKPKFVYDTWAIIHLLKEFNKTKKFLSKKDLELVKPIVEKFRKTHIEKLPHCFVHGDIITTNIMRDKKGKLWIIDFSVSNYYPRINELAVMMCNTFFVAENKKQTEKNYEIALQAYQKITPLTKKEIQTLPTYVDFAHAMHVIGPMCEKHIKGNNSEENKYWLEQGRAGLRQAIE